MSADDTAPSGEGAPQPRARRGPDARRLYYVQPGYVTSKTDGDRHWVSASQIARLRSNQWVALTSTYTADMIPDDAVILHPRFDGEYADLSGADA